MKKSTKKILLVWIAAAAFIILNLAYNNTSSRNVGIFFIIFIAIVATVDALKKVESENTSDTPHINIQILKEKFGKYYLVFSYWSLALMLLVLALRVVFPENQFVAQILPLVLAVFVIHGIYLLGTIAFAKSQRRRRF